MRSLSLLVPDMQAKTKYFLAKLAYSGIAVEIIETLRTKQVQEAYYAQGRSPLDHVNALRVMAGLWKITEEDNRECITWTLSSKHLIGKAIDIAPVNLYKRIWWNAPAEVWERIGVLGESCGLTWGGRWPGNKRDYPHFEIA
jgi:hypothetical protein